MSSTRTRIVARGIDTLELSYFGSTHPERIAELDAAARAAQTPEGRADGASRVELGGELWEVRFSSSQGWRWFLHSRQATVGVAKVEADADAKHHAVCKVALGAEALWTRTQAEYTRWAHTVAADLSTTCDEDPAVSRIDLCCDVAGADAMPDDGHGPRPAWVPSEDIRHFVTRARRRTKRTGTAWLSEQPEDFVDAASEVGGVSHFPHGRFTGHSFGGGGFMARLYDKRTEIAVRGHRKAWLYGVWGVDPEGDAPVWRVEFQIRRAAARALRAEGERDDGRWSAVAGRLAGMWDYCTHLWLTERYEDTHTRIENCEVTDGWRLIQTAWGHPATEVKRVAHETSPDVQLMLAQALGCAATAWQRAGRPPTESVEDVMVWAAQSLTQYAARAPHHMERLKAKLRVQTAPPRHLEEDHEGRTKSEA